RLYDDSRSYITHNTIEDNLLFFEIQEELLGKVDEVKEKLRKKHGILNKIVSPFKSLDEKEIYLVIGLKLLYDLTIELECARSRFKLLNPEFVKDISDFWGKLTYELQLSKELVNIFKESECELYIKESCHHCIVENLSKIGCLINDFVRNITAKKIAKNEQFFK
ncbi:11424_t:CDS:2, partial [Dentiscutata heterogama]